MKFIESRREKHKINGKECKATNEKKCKTGSAQ
jgi:hypothetical protein